MKFAVTLTFISTAMAAGIVARDATVVKGVMSTVKSDIESVKSAADAYKGDKTDLVKAADQLVSDLKEGKSKVEAGPDLTLSDAVELGTAVTDLSKAGAALTDSLTARKSEVEKAGECKTVQDQIAAISENSNNLIDAVIAKVPENAKSIAQDLASKLTTVLEQAESSYKDCTNSGNGGSSSTGSGSSGTATGTKTTGTGSATKTGTGSATATKTGGATTTICSTATGTGGMKPTSSQVTVPTGAAALYAPAGALAAVAAALAL